MKKITNLNIKVLLLIIITLSYFIIPFKINSKTIDEVKKSAAKGDIYNPQTNVISSSTSINAHNYFNDKTYENGDVEVKKSSN